MRRLTRLEPPYFLIMILLFLFLSATQLYTAKGLTPHLISSLFYVHNIIYPGSLPLINSVAWSLEIEIQFYIIVPLLARVFKLSKHIRRTLLVLIMVTLPIIQYYYKSDILFFYQFIQYFIGGFLLADIYINNDNQYYYKPANRIRKNMLAVLGVFVFAGILATHSTRTGLVYSICIPLAIVSFYYIVLFIPFWKNVFGIKLLTVIGGMSYTIYLIHLPVISTFGRFFVKYGVTNTYLIYFVVQFIIMGILTIIPAAIFFYFIERPCMQKDWYKKLFTKSIAEK